MMALLDQIPQEEKDQGIVVCGDLIDRGPRSRQVVQWCIDNKIPVVRGNHEQMMIDEAMEEAAYFLKNKTFRTHYFSSCIWGPNGGWDTIESYIKMTEEDDGVNAEFDFSTLMKHLEWMKDLPYYLEYEDIKNDKGEHLLITHSSAQGVWKYKDREDLKTRFNNELIWCRPYQINAIKGIFNVFGHTPIENGPKIKSCYANIDTGGCFTKIAGLGKLTALEFPSMKVYQQENIDKEEKKESSFGRIE